MNSVCRKCLLKVVYVIADVEDDVGESIVDSFVTSDNLAQLDNIIFTFKGQILEMFDFSLEFIYLVMVLLRQLFWQKHSTLWPVVPLATFR